MRKTLLKSVLVFLLIACLISCSDSPETPMPTSIELLSEGVQEGVVGQQLNDAIVVMVKDQFGKPLKDVMLVGSVKEGSLAQVKLLTGTDGIARFVWKLGLSELQQLYITVIGRNSTKIEGLPIHVDATAALSIVTDVDGNIYSTVRIGKQIWLAENLRTTRYSDGTKIPLVEDAKKWANLSNTDKAYCYYGNAKYSDVRCGILYTWAAATKGEGYSTRNPSGIQGVCPDGWHIPSSDEWIQLYTFLGGAKVAGGKMKEANLISWLTPNTGATNSSGFTALSTGYRGYDGRFFCKGLVANYWSTTENCMPCGPSKWWLSSDVADCYHGGSSYFNSGYSVRCVMDND